MIFDEKNKEYDYLKSKIFVGLVEKNTDPRRKGRIKVRVQGIFNDIDIEHIPWGSRYKNTDGKNFSVPAVGKIVNVIFPHGNLYEYEYIYSENYNINLQNKLTNLSDNEYTDFIALLFDNRTQIYSDDTQLMMDYQQNQVSIKKDSINLHLKDNSQKLNLGHNQASQSALLGDHFLTWFDEFITMFLDVDKQYVLGNLGAPILKPKLDEVMTKYFALRITFLSQHVKVVDNASCLSVGAERENAPTKDDFTKINDEPLLSSSEVAEPVKDEILTNRTDEKALTDEVAPNPEDVISNEELEADSPITETTTPTIENIDDLLSEEEKAQLNKSKSVQNSNNIVKPVATTAQTTDTTDPYSNFWVGRTGRSADSFKKVENPVYGTYSDNTTYEWNSVNSVDTSAYKAKQLSKITTDGRTVKNGELGTDDLQTIMVNGVSYQFEKNAASDFIKLNAAFKAKFGINLPLNNVYRTFEKQVQYKVQGLPAATPGRSNHGWGLAFDFNTFDGSIKGYKSKYYIWLLEQQNKGLTYKWKNPDWAKEGGSGTDEPWHWEYFGTSIYA